MQHYSPQATPTRALCKGQACMARLLLLAASNLAVLLVSGILIVRRRPQKYERRVRHWYHIVCNALGIAVAACCIALNTHLAFLSPTTYEYILVAVTWVFVLSARLLYFACYNHRGHLSTTATVLSLNAFIFSSFPSYIYPLIVVSYNGGLSSMSLAERLNLASTIAASIIVPAVTPFHHAALADGGKPHPSKTCSPIVRWWTHGWITPFVLLGYQRRGNVTMDDLPMLRPESSPSIWHAAYTNARSKTGSSHAALWLIFRGRLALMAFLMILCGVTEFLGVIGLRSLLQYLQGHGEPVLFRPWFSALLFGISPIVRGLCMQTFEYFSTQNICYLKGMVIAAIYQKLLYQRPHRRPDPGHVTNHVAADIDRVAMLRYAIMAGFMVPVEVVVASVILYQTMGWSYIPGLFILVVSRIPISWYISRYQSLAQSRVMAAIDSRVGRINQVIHGIQTIKMLGQSKAFSGWVDEKRRMELKAIWQKLIVIATSDTISSAFVLVPLLMTLTIYTLVAGMPLTPAVLFTAVSVFSTLKSMLSLAVIGTNSYAQSTVSLARVLGFLDDAPDLASLEFGAGLYSDVEPEEILGAENVAVGYPPLQGYMKPVLSDVSIEIVTGGLNLITGKTGSGKSTLIRALLSELPLINGKVNIRRNPSEAISYAGQTPWLVRGSIRENILFNSPFSAKRYGEVIRAVNLESDLVTIPGGDDANVGEAGTTLSGGQRARVAIARALYAETSTIVLDDVLSALDANTSNWIVNNCILGPILKDRTVILVSQNQKCRDVAALVIEVDNGTAKTISRPATNHVHVDKSFGVEITEQERLLESPRDSLQSPALSSSEPVPQEPSSRDTTPEIIHQGTNGRFIMLRYMRLFGSPLFLAALCLTVLAAQSSDIASSLWLTKWSGEYQSKSTASSPQGAAYNIVVYAAICTGQLSLTTLASLMFFRGGIQAGKKMHQQMLSSLFGAVYTWITQNPAGHIINRFSSDMFSIDNILIELLKQVVENFLSIGFRLAAVSSTLPAFLFPVAFFLTLGLFTGHVYIFSSTAAKKLYSASLSPLLSGVSDAVSGIEVIRAHRVHSAFRDKFMQSLAQYLRGWEAVSATQRWLAVRMDLFAGLISLSTATLALWSGASPATVGFSMTSSTTLCTALLYVVHLSSVLEVEMTSFQRVEEYTMTVPQERDFNADAPASPDDCQWPSEGRLEVERLTASYSVDGEPVLEDINLSVSPGRRIAIVGRSGSGKSSLVAGILRLATKLKGVVSIDGVDIETVQVERLRSSMTFIPQSPTLFEGSLRFNIDFSGAISDQALETVLSHVFGPEGTRSSSWSLDRHIEANGSNLSQGERQLVAMARALATDAKIVILDEATANLDKESETRMRTLLTQEFSNKSVVAIAHRLESIMDFDEVLVMEKGRVVERGNPRALADAAQGQFSKLWQAQQAS